MKAGTDRLEAVVRYESLGALFVSRIRCDPIQNHDLGNSEIFSCLRSFPP